MTAFDYGGVISPGEPDGDLVIPGETDVVPPGIKVDPAPPGTDRPGKRPEVTAPPAEGDKAKPAGASAVTAGCWTLLASALLAVRL